MSKRGLTVLSAVVLVAFVACGSDKAKDDKEKDDKAVDDKANKTPASDTKANKKPADTKGDDTPTPVAKDKDEPTAATPAQPAKPGAPAPVMLVGVSQGDMGCYLEVEDAKGEALTHLGGFDLCPGGEADASDLQGSKVRLTIAKEQIPAGSCEGDPECMDTEEADVVTAVIAAE